MQKSHYKLWPFIGLIYFKLFIYPMRFVYTLTIFKLVIVSLSFILDIFLFAEYVIYLVFSMFSDSMSQSNQSFILLHFSIWFLKYFWQ